MAATAPAGYSGKPVHQKLGITPASRLVLRQAPDDYAELIGLHERDMKRVGARETFDIAHVFAVSAATLQKELDALSRTLPAKGVLWVSWPKKASRVATDITEDTVRTIALPLGLVDVKVCAIDAIWSGLKLVWRLDRRAGKA